MTKDNTFQFLVGKKNSRFYTEETQERRFTCVSDLDESVSTASTTPLARVAPRSCVSRHASLALAEDSLALHFLFMELWVVKEGFTCQCFDKT